MYTRALTMGINIPLAQRLWVNVSKNLLHPQGHYSVVEYLLNTGADPNAKVTSIDCPNLTKLI